MGSESVKEKTAQYKLIICSAREAGATPRIEAFEALQAVARLKLGKGTKKGQLPMEVLKGLPYAAKLAVVAGFREYVRDTNHIPDRE